MRISAKFRYLITLIMLLSLLSPIAATGFGEGKKQFKKGMKHEVAEEWDQAAEAFALAVADNPKNPEYRLHYIRAIFNASQMYMKKGRMLAEESDYAGAYIAFRKAYAYDPVNELARSEMMRMIRMQKALIDGNDPEDAEAELKLVKTSLSGGPEIPDDVAVPQRYEKLRDVPFPSGVDLQFLITELARDLDLNVLFDTQSFRSPKRIKIELKNVTAAKALDYIFLQEGLFFEKVGPRTIIIAASARRQFFQQLVLRTFYLANADPADVEKTIKGAIPAQPGRTPTIVLTDEDTNSLTVRDTVENIRLIEQLIKSLDKDRAEVVMDVQIYEVSKSDLLQFGNQIGTQGTLTNLRGTTGALVRGNAPANRGVFDTLGKTDIFGVALAVPAANLAAFQRKDDTKLLASTQIHAFNNEDSSARIGQRVPVQTASVSSFNTTTPGSPNPGNIFGTGFPVINYEQVGLTLKFKPIVFPNQDVQVTMEIESKDIVNAGSLTPTFTERTIKGTARVQNNKTLLLASVAQGVESKGREGLPLLGMIPILGRLFTAPTRDNRQVDIVIAVTPRVIRAPAVLPEDVVERQTGSLAVPTSGSLDALLIREEIERQQALARRSPSKVEVQLPGKDAPAYVKSTGTDTVSRGTDDVGPGSDTTASVAPKAESAAPYVPENADNESLTAKIKPIESGSRTLDLARSLVPESSDSDAVKVQATSLSSPEGPRNLLTGPKKQGAETSPSTEVEKPGPVAVLEMLPKFPEMNAGERLKVVILVKSSTPFRSAVMGLVYDETKVAVRSVAYGDVFGAPLANSDVLPFFNQYGKTYVSLTSAKDVAGNSSGVLSFVEVEALVDGVPQITFDPELMNILSADGINFVVRY